METDWAKAFEEAENEEEALLLEEHYSKLLSKDYLLFAIDASLAMRKDEDEWTAKASEAGSPLRAAIQCAAVTMQNKIMSSPNDQMGLLFFNSAIANNPAGFEGTCLLHTLAVPDPGRIMELERLQKDATYFEATVGSSTEQVSMANVLGTCASVFSELKAKEGVRRIFLFTNNEDPHARQPSLRRAALTRASDLVTAGIQLELFDLVPAVCTTSFDKTVIFKPTFNFAAFYRDIVTIPLLNLSMSQGEQEETLLERYLGASNDAARSSRDKVAELLHRVIKKETPKRTLSRLPFILDLGGDKGQPVFLGTKLYALFVEAKKPSGLWIHREDNEELKTVVTYVQPSTGQVLSNVAEHSAAEYKCFYELGGQKAVFTWAELHSDAVKDFGPPGFTLLGFKPMDRLKPYHNISHSLFLYPDELAVKGSTRFMHLLIARCLHKQVFIVAKFIQRRRATPRLVALLPHAEDQMNEDVAAFAHPAGFSVIILPFADEIRSIDGLKGPKPATDASVDAMKKIVSKLTLREYKFDDIENPNLQRFYAVLEALALERDFNESNCKDLTLPDAEGMKKRIGGLVAELENLLPDGDEGLREETSPSSKKRSRRLMKSLDDPASASDSISTKRRARPHQDRAQGDEESESKYKPKGASGPHTPKEGASHRTTRPQRTKKKLNDKVVSDQDF